MYHFNDLNPTPHQLCLYIETELVGCWIQIIKVIHAAELVVCPKLSALILQSSWPEGLGQPVLLSCLELRQ